MLKSPARKLERLLIEQTSNPCGKCPYWQHRSGHRVNTPTLKAILVRGALDHPWTVAFGTVGLAIGTIVGHLVAR